MKLPPIEFMPARTVREAIGLLSEYGDDAKVLAGGQSLIPLMALRIARPTVLVDVNDVDELDRIAVADGHIRIGATTRHRAVETSTELHRAEPMLAAAARYIGHRAIRNRGTMGGSLAHADPAAEWPLVLATLDGGVEVAGPDGTRRIAAHDLFGGFLSTTLEPGELLTTVEIPIREGRTGWAFQEFARRSGDFALVGCAVALWLDDGTVTDVRIGLSGVAGTPLRATRAEGLLRGSDADPALIADAARAAAEDAPVGSDIHGTEAYRRHLVGSLTRRSVVEALDRARGKAV